MFASNLGGIHNGILAFDYACRAGMFVSNMVLTSVDTVFKRMADGLALAGCDHRRLQPLDRNPVGGKLRERV
jgi:hypothetical protein